MADRLSTLFVRTLREDPHDADVASHKLLIRAGYIRRAAPGIYSWLPLGLKVLGKVEQIVREEMNAIGGQEVHFPALLPKEPYEATGRWEEYGEGIFRLQDRKEADYLLAPTHEEMFTLLVKDLYSSYKDLPLMLYQIQTKYRDEARPRAGLLRVREFIMKDAYSFNIDDEGLEEAYQAQRAAYLKIFERLGLEVVPVQATAGAMGGSKSEEFLNPCDIGEDTFVVSPGGFAANVEAVATVVPPAQPYDDAPAPVELATPGTKTIGLLVDYTNEHLSAELGRKIDPAETLKHLVLSVTAPTGETELVVLALPGDRDVDMKRIEANLGTIMDIPGELIIEPATDEQLAKVPGLVPGFMGPGTDKNAPFFGLESSTGLRYLVDPRVVPGSRWVAGANKADTHVYNLVAERDFTFDDTIECTAVRDGDPAPDGSGPLTTRRGIEMGHIFQLGRKYAEALDLKVLDQNGKATVVTMGSYGVGVTRAVAALAQANHDDKGLCWPQAVAPYNVHVVATGKGEEVFDTAEQLTNELEAAGIEVLYDDRKKVSPGVKFSDAELIGVPVILVVGRGLANGEVEIKNRATGEAVNVPVAEAVASVTELVNQG
ncbi:proline--tRNA ligase [Micrococcoides hystricis]|uniref:Proline--tRNA ligase n=1 Tax=Micrococcoides hystricis TaxID=1572761 RepID=A0ABV6P8P3_9MICC